MTTETQNNRNGSKPSTPPSIEDFFMISDKANPNVLIEMMTTSTNPQEYIPRANLSRRDAAAIQRIIILFSIWKKREVNIGEIVWNRLAYSIAEEGRGRSDVISMFTGMGKRVMDGLRGVGRGRQDFDGTNSGGRR